VFFCSENSRLSSSLKKICFKYFIDVCLNKLFNIHFGIPNNDALHPEFMQLFGEKMFPSNLKFVFILINMIILIIQKHVLFPCICCQFCTSSQTWINDQHDDQWCTKVGFCKVSNLTWSQDRCTCKIFSSGFVACLEHCITMNRVELVYLHKPTFNVVS
jgi:hypothetical protein